MRNDGERFWSKVDIRGDNDCWNWHGAINSTSYGSFLLNGKIGLAHRAAWILTHGDIPKGMCILHHCDNPKCVNPNHLFVGTQKDNAIDRNKKGRASSRVGERNGRAILSYEDVLQIRKIRSEAKLSWSKIAKLFGVHLTTVRYAAIGETWNASGRLLG